MSDGNPPVQEPPSAIDDGEAQSLRRSGHLLLAAITPGAVSEQVVRRTRQLAGALGCPWIALYVEIPGVLDDSDQARIAMALALAGELGAEVITTAGIDRVNSLLRVARQRNVTQIVIGKPPVPISRLFQKDGDLRRLARESGEVDIQVVSSKPEPHRPFWSRWRILHESTAVQYLIAVGVVMFITAVAVLLGSRIGPPHAAALLFLLGVVVLGSFVGRGPSLLAALMSALFWDYFILPPIYEFRITHIGDGLVFGMYFFVALMMGQLTSRIRAQQEIERQGEERATALYLLTRELTDATSLDQIVQKAVQEMERAFKARIAVLLSDTPGQLQPPHPAGTFKLTEEGLRLASGVFTQGRQMEKFTGNRPLAHALYVPLASGEGMIGVIGLQFTQSFSPTVHQRNLLDGFCQQITLALDRHRMRGVLENARLLAESERLSKTLLDSMSHEIRTPIAAIKGATTHLIEFEETHLSVPQQAMIAEIQEGTERLNRLVGNILEITRLESGHFKPKLNECDVNDLVHLAVAETERELARHQLVVELAPNLPIVPMDFVLMQQALTNLLSNAALHTPPGTAVKLSARVEGGDLLLRVADEGRGIPPESVPHIFDKFYRCAGAPTGGTGLGLSLVKGFVEAHGGRVKAENLTDGGAAFTIRLPLQVAHSVTQETHL